MKEVFYQCPYCWEQVSILVDYSQGQQKYIEDCEVCCNPIEFRIQCTSQKIVDFQVQNIEQ
jgi:transcription elongation factor Elf1